MIILLIVLGGVAVIGIGYFAYTKYFSGSSTTDNSDIGQVPTTKITVPTLDESALNDPRFYKLNEPNFSGFTNQQEAVSLSKDIPLPVDEIKTANPGYGRTLIISWQLPDFINFTNVRVYRSTSYNSLGDVATTLPVDSKNPGKSSSFLDTGLTDNQVYYYRIRTVNSDSKESIDISAASGIPTDYIPPASPTSIQVEPQDNGGIKISWVNPADSDFASINIYRSTARGVLGDIIYMSSNGNITENDQINRFFLDENTEPNVPYFYTVTSVDYSGNESSRDILAIPSRDSSYNPFNPIVF